MVQSLGWNASSNDKSNRSSSLGYWRRKQWQDDRHRVRDHWDDTLNNLAGLVVSHKTGPSFASTDKNILLAHGQAAKTKRERHFQIRCRLNPYGEVQLHHQRNTAAQRFG